jgi:hypothetical protein
MGYRRRRHARPGDILHAAADEYGKHQVLRELLCLHQRRNLPPGPAHQSPCPPNWIPAPARTLQDMVEQGEHARAGHTDCILRAAGCEGNRSQERRAGACCSNTTAASPGTWACWFGQGRGDDGEGSGATADKS